MFKFYAYSIQFSTQYFISIESGILCADTVFSTKLHPGTNRAARNFLLSDYNEPNKRIIKLKCKIFYRGYKGIKFIEYITFQYEENMVRKNNFNMDVVVRDAIDYIVESKTVCNVNISKQTFP